MKKLLMLLAIFLSSIFLIDNVSALEQTDFSDDDMLFSGGYDKFYYNETLDKENLYIFHTYQGNVTKTVINLNEYPYFLLNKTYGVFYYSSIELYYNTSDERLYNVDNIKFYRRVSGNWEGATGSNSSYALASANDSIIYLNFNLNNESGDLFISKNINLSSTPTIEITEESKTSITILDQEYITDVTLNVKFSSIDNDKYTYMYKYGSDSDWSTITLIESNSFSKTYSENNTLYVQILDISDNSVVASNTFTISSINYDFTPYITIEEITEDSCIMGDYILCQSLRINSHIADFDRYKFIVIDHTQNTTEEIKEMTIYRTYYINSNIEVKIVDKSTGSSVDQKNFTIATISEETENLGQYIKQECYFASIGYNYLCNYYFYNYDPDSYIYYYGTSSSTFEELKLKTGTESTFDKTIYKLQDGLGKLKEVSYNENTTVYFKVVDQTTSEIIYTKTFTISYDTQLEESGKGSINNLFSQVTSYFNDSMAYIKIFIEVITNFYNNLNEYFRGFIQFMAIFISLAAVVFWLDKRSEK